MLAKKFWIHRMLRTLFSWILNLILLTNGYAFEEMEIWGFFLPLNFVVVVRASEDCARSFGGLQPPLIFYSFNPHTHIETRCNFRICFVRIYLIFDIVSENFTNTEKLKYFVFVFLWLFVSQASSGSNRSSSSIWCIDLAAHSNWASTNILYGHPVLFRAPVVFSILSVCLCVLCVSILLQLAHF